MSSGNQLLVTNYQKWNFFLDKLESPQIFIDYTWLLTVAAALQRRVCLDGFPGPSYPNVYPNMFCIFVGDSGIGKTVAGSQAKTIYEMMDTSKDGKKVETIKRGPSSTTLEALTKYLGTNYTYTNIPPELVGGVAGKIYHHCSLALFCTEELGTLLREKTVDLITFLTEAWDCSSYRKETKCNGIDEVPNLCITLLGSATPEWISRNMKSQLLSEGFAGRPLWVYANKKRKLSPDKSFTPEQIKIKEDIGQHLQKLTKLFGRIEMTPECHAWINKWYIDRESKPRLNKSNNLKPYYARLMQHLKKVAIAYHFSEKTTMVMDVEDFENADRLLLRTEVDMDKALTGSGRNEIAALVPLIERYLENKHDGSELLKRIQLDFFNDGKPEEVQQVLDFMEQVGKISKVINDTAGVKYKINTTS